jgi:hypothetical protein
LVVDDEALAHLDILVKDTGPPSYACFLEIGENTVSGTRLGLEGRDSEAGARIIVAWAY